MFNRNKCHFDAHFLTKQKYKVMRTNKTIILLAVTVVLMSGCAKTIWMNPNKPDKQAQIDFAECQNNAMRKNEDMQACMISKGYYIEAAKQ